MEEDELGFLFGLRAADGLHRVVARRAYPLDRASAISRALDLRRARAKSDAAGNEARAALDAAKNWLTVSRSDSERSYVEPFRATERMAVLHGRVHGPDGAGLAGLIVRVTLADGRPFGETKTGDHGYFKIEAGGDTRTPGRLPTIDTSAAAATNTPRGGVHVALYDGERPILVEKGTTLLRLGTAVYREFRVELSRRG